MIYIQANGLRGIKIKIKCHNCGKINDLNIEPAGTDAIYEFSLICKNCGAFNVISVNPSEPDLADTELQGTPVQGFEWVLPSGKIVPVIGDTVYISANGEHLSRKAYMDIYKLDPEIAYIYMRRKLDAKVASKVANPSNKDIAMPSRLELANIQKIEVLCMNCGGICELIP
ncbi:MAG: hypothetical protein LUQ59_04245 [Methanothrix sp.]|nr:hypothetical protein [Methanothrix sp.]